MLQEEYQIIVLSLKISRSSTDIQKQWTCDKAPEIIRSSLCFHLLMSEFLLEKEQEK